MFVGYVKKASQVDVHRHRHEGYAQKEFMIIIESCFKAVERYGLPSVIICLCCVHPLFLTFSILFLYTVTCVPLLSFTLEVRGLKHYA